MFLSNKQKEIILEIFGEKRYNEAIRCIDIYAEKWQLEKFELIDVPARNLVLNCISPQYGSCVLKIGFDDFDRASEREINVLRTFNNRGYCQLYEYSIADKTFLLERIFPGDDLWYETTRNERGALFSNLYRAWYAVTVELANFTVFPTILSIFENKDADIFKNDCDFIVPHIKKSKELILSLNSIYPDTIIHGDLSFRNILKNRKGEYTAIDPTGFIGVPIHNISQFIISEFGNNISYEPIENLLNFIDLLYEKTDISHEIIKICLYVETVLALCQLEFANGKKLNDYAFMVENTLTAEKLLN